ncbi:hypothetical protein EYF80_041671 [Liparis tanakae]|uniref:Uncharacterized protein n=1 Tax=Liparis tanakae TaxID=230148 RepID=A0A4Z2G5K5_9TELE|nr:hypothetical protein EYF80_041671 [Liparis tanakae]
MPKPSVGSLSRGHRPQQSFRFLVRRRDVRQVLEERSSVDAGSVVLSELPIHPEKSFLHWPALVHGPGLPVKHGCQDLPEVVHAEERHAVCHRRHFQMSLGRRARRGQPVYKTEAPRRLAALGREAPQPQPEGGDAAGEEPRGLWRRRGVPRLLLGLCGEELVQQLLVGQRRFAFVAPRGAEARLPGALGPSQLGPLVVVFQGFSRHGVGQSRPPAPAFGRYPVLALSRLSVAERDVGLEPGGEPVDDPVLRHGGRGAAVGEPAVQRSAGARCSSRVAVFGRLVVTQTVDALSASGRGGRLTLLSWGVTSVVPIAVERNQ